MDLVIYRDLLHSVGYAVEIVNIVELAAPEPNATCLADVQVFYERVHPNWLVAGRYNMFVINHEISHDLGLYHQLDAIIAKSLLAKTLLEDYVRSDDQVKAGLKLDIFYLSHTSLDPREKLVGLPSMHKDFTQFIHLGGKSINKGSEVVYETWRKHPEWPMLHLVDFKHSGRYFRKAHVAADLAYNQMPDKTGVMIRPNLILYTERLPDRQLIELQQTCGVHLCPSREEGFGHYINEARALGALVMTSDWGPMNELVRDHFGVLVPCQLTTRSLYRSSLPGNKACHVTGAGLEEAMQKYFRLMTKIEEVGGEDGLMRRKAVLTTERVNLMGQYARMRYEDERDAFRERMRDLFVNVLPNKLAQIY